MGEAIFEIDGRPHGLACCASRRSNFIVVAGPGLLLRRFRRGVINHCVSIIIQNYRVIGAASRFHTWPRRGIVQRDYDRCMGIITLVWVVWGFSLCFGASGRFIGDPSSFAMLNGVDGSPLKSEARGKEARPLWRAFLGWSSPRTKGCSP